MTLTIDRLSVTYTMKRTQKQMLAINNVSFNVGRGEFVAIVGPSGCGKTSILHAIAGILPEKRGRITLAGQEINAPGRDRAMVFQSPALLPWRSVARNVAYGLELHGYKLGEARQQAQRFIDLVGLHGFEESYPGELSGGMQQRANLARALAVQPQVLLFDEPLSALDAQTRELMQLELQRIWMQSGLTALFVTHHIREAIFLADRVIVMTPSPGEIKEIVPVDFPRPRTLSMQRSAPFIALEDRIWGQLTAAAGVGDLMERTRMHP